MPIWLGTQFSLVVQGERCVLYKVCSVYCKRCAVYIVQGVQCVLYKVCSVYWTRCAVCIVQGLRYAVCIVHDVQCVLYTCYLKNIALTKNIRMA